MTEAIRAMRKAATPQERRLAPAGWLVKVHAHYYTGHGRSELERWTRFPKFAKLYRRQAWAKKIAEQLGGQAVLAEGPALAPDKTLAVPARCTAVPT